MKSDFPQSGLSGKRAHTAGAIDLKLVLLLLLAVAAAGWWVISHREAVQARERESAEESNSTAQSPYAKVMRIRPADQVIEAQVVNPTLLANPVNQAVLGLAVVLAGVVLLRRFSAASAGDLELALAGGRAGGGTLASGAGMGEAGVRSGGIAVPGLNSESESFAGQDQFAIDEESTQNEYAAALKQHAPEHLAGMRDRLLDLEAESTPGARQEVLEEIYMGMRSLGDGAERAEMKELKLLAAMTEKLVQKVMEQPAMATESVNQTLLRALWLMSDLCLLQGKAGRLDAEISALAVDDDLISQRTLGTALHKCVASLEVAGNGKVAIDKAAVQKYDLIFMDVMMPQVDGFQACAKLREGLNRETPVVFITAKGDKESIRKARESGGNGFIAKPILPAEIPLVALTVAWRSRLDATTRGKRR